MPSHLLGGSGPVSKQGKSLWLRPQSLLMHLSQPSEVGASAGWHQSTPHNPTNRQNTEVHHQLQPTHLSTDTCMYKDKLARSQLKLNPKNLSHYWPHNGCVSRDNPAHCCTAYAKHCNHKGPSTKWASCRGERQMTIAL